MTTPSTTSLQPVTTSELGAAGLTAGQIARLVEFRRYCNAMPEFFTKREIQHLRFLRWQVERGLLEPG